MSSCELEPQKINISLYLSVLVIVESHTNNYHKKIHYVSIQCIIFEISTLI